MFCTEGLGFKALISKGLKHRPRKSRLTWDLSQASEKSEQVEVEDAKLKPNTALPKP